LQYVLAWICCWYAPVLKPAVCLHNVAAVAPGAGATVSEALGAFQPGAASGRQHGICMQIDNDHLPRQAWDTHIHLQMGKSLTQTAAAVSLFCTMTCRGHRLPSKPSVASAVATVWVAAARLPHMPPGNLDWCEQKKTHWFISRAAVFCTKKPIVCRDGLRTVKHAEILTQALCDLFSSSQGEGRRRVGADTTATWRRGGRATAVDI
jgi:hypothetical protein